MEAWTIDNSNNYFLVLMATYIEHLIEVDVEWFNIAQWWDFRKFSGNLKPLSFIASPFNSCVLQMSTADDVRYMMSNAGSRVPKVSLTSEVRCKMSTLGK